MNIGKTAFFITGAAILISGTAAWASARTVDGSGKTHIGSIALIEARPAAVGEQASLKSPLRSHDVRLAFNPQPDPPGVHDEFDY
jgi:hypothetical protein